MSPAASKEDAQLTYTIAVSCFGLEQCSLFSQAELRRVVSSEGLHQYGRGLLRARLLTFTTNSPVPARSGGASAVNSIFLVKHGHRIGRPITFPNGQASPDGRCDEILGSSHAFSNCLLVGQIGRNGRSEDATGTVCVLGVDTLSAKLSEFTAVVEDVGGYVFQMTTLDDDVFWSKVADRPGGLFHVRKSFDFASRERPGFMQVGCDHGG